jgi:hypothetical protein
MINIYKKASLLGLFVAGLALLCAAQTVRRLSGLEVLLLNGLFLPVAVASYFLPPIVIDKAKGEALSRKLLWLIVAAGFVVLAAEVIRLIIGSGPS